MSRHRRRGLFVILLAVAMLAVGGLAAAAPAQHPADADADTDERLSPIEFEYLQDDHLLVYWLTADEPVEGEPEDEPVDCTEGLGEDEDAEVAEDVDVEGDDGELELPEGCYVVDVTGPNGQVNHGTVMSAFVHSLKELDFEGPRGLAVRQVAHSDLGKGDQQVKSGEGVEVEDDDRDEDPELDGSDEGHGPPDHANANARDKKPKKPKKAKKPKK